MRDKDLEDIFAQARLEPPLESAALMARVLADAESQQPRLRGQRRSGDMHRRAGWWATLAAAVGGWGVLAGLGTAALVGVMFGYAQPASNLALAVSIFAEDPLEEVELIPGIDALFIEG